LPCAKRNNQPNFELKITVGQPLARHRSSGHEADRLDSRAIVRVALMAHRSKEVTFNVYRNDETQRQ
jgi:hypothetical protein